MSSVVVCAAGFQTEDLWIVAGLAGYVARTEHSLEGTPGEGVAQIGVKGNVDARLRPAGVTARTVEEDDVFVEVGVVVDGGAPMGIGVFGLPGASGWEDGRDFAAEAGFFEFAEVELFDIAYGCEAIFESHAGGGDALGRSGAGVVGKEEIEEFSVFVEDDADVAVAAGEETVFSIAVDGVAGLKNDAEVLDSGTVVAGNGSSDFGGGEVGTAAALFWLVVVEEQEGAVIVAPDGFKPDGAVLFGIEIYFAGICEAELIGAGGEVWDAC